MTMLAQRGGGGAKISCLSNRNLPSVMPRSISTSLRWLRCNVRTIDLSSLEDADAARRCCCRQSCSENFGFRLEDQACRRFDKVSYRWITSLGSYGRVPYKKQDVHQSITTCEVDEWMQWSLA